METLNDLMPGECGTIRSVTAEGDLRRRLMDMGVIEGAPVVMVKPAPLGDPVQILIHHTFIALRKKEAGTIFIEKRGMHKHGRCRHHHRAGR